MNLEYNDSPIESSDPTGGRVPGVARVTFPGLRDVERHNHLNGVDRGRIGGFRGGGVGAGDGSRISGFRSIARAVRLRWSGEFPLADV